MKGVVYGSLLGSFKGQIKQLHLNDLIQLGYHYRLINLFIAKCSPKMYIYLLKASDMAPIGSQQHSDLNNTVDGHLFPP